MLHNLYIHTYVCILTNHYLNQIKVVTVDDGEYFETKWMIMYWSGHHRYFFSLKSHVNTYVHNNDNIVELHTYVRTLPDN